MLIKTVLNQLENFKGFPEFRDRKKVAPLCRFFEGIFLRFPPSIPTQVIRPPHV